MFKAEVYLVFNSALANVIINEGKNGKDDGDLGNTNTGVTEGVDDVPGMAEPGNFSKNQTTDKSGKRELFVTTLRKNVAASGVADEERKQSNDDRVKFGSADSDSANT